MWHTHSENNEIVFDLFITNQWGYPPKKDLNDIFTIKSSLPESLINEAILKITKKEDYIVLEKQFKLIWKSSDDDFLEGLDMIDQNYEDNLPQKAYIYGCDTNFLAISCKLNKAQKRKLARKFLADIKLEVLNNFSYLEFKYSNQEERKKIKNLNKLIKYNELDEDGFIELVNSNVLLHQNITNQYYLYQFKDFQNTFQHFALSSGHLFQEINLGQVNNIIFHSEIEVIIDNIDWDFWEKQKFYFLDASYNQEHPSYTFQSIFGVTNKNIVNFALFSKHSLKYLMES